MKGEWIQAQKTIPVVDPLNGEPMLTIPFTSVEELRPFARSLGSCPKSGLHNPLRGLDRYLLYGNVCRKAAAMMHEVLLPLIL